MNDRFPVTIWLVTEATAAKASDNYPAAALSLAR
jgi:hypothetical protein